MELDQVCGILTINLPLSVVKWKIYVPSLLVNDGIPYSMKLVNSSAGYFRNREVVAASVSIRILSVEPIFSVERLMDITRIVNKKSQSHGLSIFLSVSNVPMTHNLLVLERFSVTCIIFEPVYDSRQGLCNVMRI